MASWSTSPERSYRSSSPTSPLSPLPASGLPQWFRQTKARAPGFPAGRFKVLAIATGCILLGWLMTSALSPNTLPSSEAEYYDIASTGMLSGPDTADPKLEPGAVSQVHGLSQHHNGVSSGSGSAQDHVMEGPTIKGALGDLHQAVSDRLQKWSPYGSKPSSTTQNHTSTLTGPVKPVNSTFVGEVIREGLGEDEKLGARTRVGKCTVLSNNEPFWERALKTHEVHDKIHGYRLHVLRQQVLDGFWNKTAYILSLLLRELSKPESERLEWLFWADADTIILNPYIPIEAFLPPAGTEFDDIHLLYSSDWNGLNAGVFPVRVNKWSVELFTAMLAFRYYRPDSDLTFADQSAMNTLMNEPKFAKNIMQLPQRWFNAYRGDQTKTLQPYEFRRGDFLVHFAGVMDTHKGMDIWLERAEGHSEDWELPYKSTSYPQEIKDFWAEQHELRKKKKASIAETRAAASAAVSKTEELLAEYKERLSQGQVDEISKTKEQMKKMLSDEKTSENVEKLKEQKNKLDEVSKPLTTAMGDSHKTLLASTHDAIFAGEKDLHDAAGERDRVLAEAETLQKAVKQLKDLILRPEEQWNRATIISAMDAVTSARSQHAERVMTVRAADEAARKAKEEEEQAKIKQAMNDKVVEEQRQAAQQAQAEAEMAIRSKQAAEATSNIQRIKRL